MVPAAPSPPSLSFVSAAARLSWLLAALLMFNAGTFLSSAVAAQATWHRKTVPNLTDDQQYRVMQAFGRAFPDLQTFARRFPRTQLVIMRDLQNPQKASMTGTVTRSHYAVSIRVSGVFDEDFTTLQSSTFDEFGGTDLSTIRAHEVRSPTKFAPAELADFCADPDTFVAKKLGSAHR